MNISIIIGNLTREPERYATLAGDSICRFTIANNDDKERPIFVPCSTYGKLSENCLTYLHKGSKVLVSGKLRIYESDKNGVKYKNTEIFCNQVEFLTPKNEQPDNDMPFPDVPERPQEKRKYPSDKKEEVVLPDDMPF